MIVGHVKLRGWVIIKGKLMKNIFYVSVHTSRFTASFAIESLFQFSLSEIEAVVYMH